MTDDGGEEFGGRSVEGEVTREERGGDAEVESDVSVEQGRGEKSLAKLEGNGQVNAELTSRFVGKRPSRRR